MRLEPTFSDYDDEDGEELTAVFWQPPVMPAPVLQHRVSQHPVRSYEVHDRYAIPTPIAFAPPAAFAPAQFPRATRQKTVDVRRVPRTMLGIGFAGLCVLIGISIGGVIVLTGHSSSTAHAMPVAAPAVVATKPVVVSAPVVAPIVVAPVAVKPALVTVRVESNPPGATATLVDDGKNTLVGITPVDASIDGSRQYDIILTLEDHDTQIVHVDPATQKAVSVTLAATAVEVAPAPAPVVAPIRHRHAAAAPDSRPRAVAAVAPAPAPVETGTGTLVVSSKPPTSIIVDGKPTGLTTPQRSLSMSAGHHEITLTNASEGISLTTEVDITADHATRLVQDFTK